MDGEPRSPRLAANWLPWVVRWCWLLLASLTLAWQGAAGREVLFALAAYAAVQLGLTAWRFWGAGVRVELWLSAAVDTLGPLAVIVAAAGEPVLLSALLIAAATSVGPWLGVVAAAVWSAGAVIGVGIGLGSMGGSPSAGLLWAAPLLPPLLLGSAGLAWLARWTQGEDKRTGVLTTQDPSLAAPKRVRGGAVPLDERLREEDLVRLTVELALESLAAAGLRREDLSGLALIRKPEELRVVGGDCPNLSRWMGQELGRHGVLAEALERRAVVQGELEPDGELSELVEELGWKRVICLPLAGDRGPFGAILIGCSKPLTFQEDHLSILHSLGQEARVALRYAELYEELSRERDRLNEIQEEARKKLARDLHDGPTQVIAAIAMRTNFARRQLERDTEAAARELETVEDMARATTMEIRHMLFTLRPLILESQGLGTALRQYAEKVGETHGQRVIVEVEPAVEPLIGRDREAPLFYIAEEAVNNAQKHAASEHIWVRLRREDGGLLLEIEDDGVGFNVGAVDAHYDQRGSLGIVSMRERSQLLGGTLEIASEEGRGTSIRAHIPLNASLDRGHSGQDASTAAHP